jgi:hypothetical protein
MVRHLVIDAVGTGDVRADIAPNELVTYCLHAIGAASGLPSKAAVGRLVGLTLAGLRPPGVSRSSASRQTSGAGSH